MVYIGLLLQYILMICKKKLNFVSILNNFKVKANETKPLACTDCGNCKVILNVINCNNFSKAQCNNVIQTYFCCGIKRKLIIFSSNTHCCKMSLSCMECWNLKKSEYQIKVDNECMECEVMNLNTSLLYYEFKYC